MESQASDFFGLRMERRQCAISMSSAVLFITLVHHGHGHTVRIAACVRPNIQDLISVKGWGLEVGGWTGLRKRYNPIIPIAILTNE